MDLDTLLASAEAMFPAREERLRADFPTLVAAREDTRRAMAMLRAGSVGASSTPSGLLLAERLLAGEAITTGNSGWGGGPGIGGCPPDEDRLLVLHEMATRLDALVIG